MKEDIIRMAREADISESHAQGMQGFLERFAALVAAAERERIIAANAPEIEKINAHIKALEEAVVAEREACAKVCEEFESEADPDAGFVLAAAILARSEA